MEIWRDPERIVFLDKKHSSPTERRYFLLGLVKGRVLTVRFTPRGRAIRIIGAGYWRQGKALYEQENTGR